MFLNIKENFLDLKESFLDIEEVFLNLKESFLDIEEVFLNLKESFLDIKEVFLDLKESFLNIKESFLNVLFCSHILFATIFKFWRLIWIHRKLFLTRLKTPWRICAQAK